jgi:hypothetical protein
MCSDQNNDSYIQEFYTDMHYIDNMDIYMDMEYPWESDTFENSPSLPDSSIGELDAKSDNQEGDSEEERRLTQLSPPITENRESSVLEKAAKKGKTRVPKKVKGALSIDGVVKSCREKYFETNEQLPAMFARLCKDFFVPQVKEYTGAVLTHVFGIPPTHCWREKYRMFSMLEANEALVKRALSIEAVQRDMIRLLLVFMESGGEVDVPRLKFTRSGDYQIALTPAYSELF